MNRGEVRVVLPVLGDFLDMDVDDPIVRLGQDLKLEVVAEGVETAIKLIRKWGWKNKGIFTGYKILFATQINEQLPDMWVILDFAKFSDIAKWHAIQREYPGGLAPDGIALGAPKTDAYADLVWQGGIAKADQSKSLYMIIPYISLVASEKYADFVNKYVVPQLTGWVESGLMPSYAIYLNQNPTNAPWHSLLLLEYDGIRGIALRGSLKEKIRGKLANDPGYKQYSDIKSKRPTAPV